MLLLLNPIIITIELSLSVIVYIDFVNVTISHLVMLSNYNLQIGIENDKSKIKKSQEIIYLGVIEEGNEESKEEDTTTKINTTEVVGDTIIKDLN